MLQKQEDGLFNLNKTSQLRTVRIPRCWGNAKEFLSLGKRMNLPNSDVSTCSAKCCPRCGLKEQKEDKNLEDDLELKLGVNDWEKDILKCGY